MRKRTRIEGTGAEERVGRTVSEAWHSGQTSEIRERQEISAGDVLCAAPTGLNVCGPATRGSRPGLALFRPSGLAQEVHARLQAEQAPRRWGKSSE